MSLTDKYYSVCVCTVYFTAVCVLVRISCFPYPHYYFAVFLIEPMYLYRRGTVSRPVLVLVVMQLHESTHSVFTTCVFVCAYIWLAICVHIYGKPFCCRPCGLRTSTSTSTSIVPVSVICVLALALPSSCKSLRTVQFLPLVFSTDGLRLCLSSPFLLLLSAPLASSGPSRPSVPAAPREAWLLLLYCPSPGASTAAASTAAGVGGYRVGVGVRRVLPARPCLHLSAGGECVCSGNPLRHTALARDLSPFVLRHSVGFGARFSKNVAEREEVEKYKEGSGFFPADALFRKYRFQNREKS